MTEGAKPKRRHLNGDERRALRSAYVGKFVQQYARRAHKGLDPNDRSYDRKVEQMISRMSPFELDALIRDDED